MTAPLIRMFEKKHLEINYKLYPPEQWNDRRSDIKQMFSYEPRGCFVAEVDGNPVGHVFSVNYGTFGWIALLMVQPKHRKKGIGTMLTQKAMDCLLNLGVETIKLDAVPEIADLYRNCGFKDEYDSLRLAATSGRNNFGNQNGIRQMIKKDLDAVACFDAEHFGGDRSRVLSTLYRENPTQCFLSQSGAETNGYVMCRRLKLGYKIGPWVCSPEQPQTARNLLAQCMGSIQTDAKVYVGTLAVNNEAAHILSERGFLQISKCIRMSFGKKLDTENTQAIFGIAGSEKG